MTAAADRGMLTRMKNSKVLIYTPVLQAVAVWGKGPAGRFGGGWNWKVGVQAGSSSLLVSLLVADLRIDLRPNHTTRRKAKPHKPPLTPRSEIPIRRYNRTTVGP